LTDALAVVLAVPLGMGIVALLCLRVFGHPFLFLSIQQTNWGRYPLLPWQSLWGAMVLFQRETAWSFPQARNLVDLGPLLLMLLLTFCAIRRMPVSFTLYMLGLLLLTLISPVKMGPGLSEFDAAGRYLLLSVPIFLLLGRWSSRFVWVEMLLVGGGFVLQAVFATYYLTGGWLI
jgi:hypothetical protein